ncbi:uncharacterized protein LOC105251045 isoform X1 [Camponotus floridanus]|uniref:uncharacterized protein LOC105251045 isoform X1 n=1 Tax=Camponotus floridanus TaxID=104421 RepID=UPI000DC6CBF2|nr:uncharacterized protein LOC105251045 isoform X1 [Camponotus floridanus]
MKAHARAPDPLTKTNDMASNWHSWKEDFIIFMKVTGYINKPNDIRANILKNRIGKIGIDAIQTMTFNRPQDKDNMDILIAKLEEFFNPPKNEIVERYHFFTRDKKHNETIQQYINILKEKAKTCNFKDTVDNVIRDKIISITQDKILLKKFFETKNLDLQKLIAIYNDYNINTEKMKQITKETIESRSTPKPLLNDTKRKCWRCNSQHPLRKCPAWGSKCTKCGDVNHFTQCCQGPKPKVNDNKINNLLNPMNQAKMHPTQQTNVSKNNNKKNYHKANSGIKDMGPMNKKTSFPGIPTAPCTAKLTFCNDPFNCTMRGVCHCKPCPSLHTNNATSQSIYSPKNTHFKYDSMLRRPY